METCVTLNFDKISEARGNRGGDGGLGYAAADAIRRLVAGTAEKIGVFEAADDDYCRILTVSEFDYYPGTHRSHPTREIYRLKIIRDDDLNTMFSAEGEYASECEEAMSQTLAEELARIANHGNNFQSDEPLDMGFDPKLHPTM